MYVDIKDLFNEFCKYLDGKLRWSDKSSVWTHTVFGFFTEYNRKQHVPYVEVKEHMRIDYIWRLDPSKYSRNDIVLAVEHENEVNNIEKLLSEEIRHLIDIKAFNKVGIFYINQGDEKDFINKISKAIKCSTPYTWENYLIILGYRTRKKKKLAILFKALFLNEKGELVTQEERVIFQRERKEIN